MQPLTILLFAQQSVTCRNTSQETPSPNRLFVIYVVSDLTVEGRLGRNSQNASNLEVRFHTLANADNRRMVS